MGKFTTRETGFADGHPADPRADTPGRRIAVVGAGIAGLTCARELSLRGHQPVIFEASDRVGGRCSSLNTPVGTFDDAAQVIGGPPALAAYAPQRPGELAALHPWWLPGAPLEDEDDELPPRTLTPLGHVGVPSMRALSDAVARPLDVRVGQAVSQAQRHGHRWVLHLSGGQKSGQAGGNSGEQVVDEDFHALVLALPAPQALPLAQPSPVVSAALRAVTFSPRWVLLVGTERPVGLPAHREFRGSPIERVVAMHLKPGRDPRGPQRWFVEADALWSAQHVHEDPETVAELLLANFSAHARRRVLPVYLRAHLWRHAFVDKPAFTMGRPACLWDEATRLGVCGDSVVASRVDSVQRSGVDMARSVASSLDPRQGPWARRSPYLARPPASGQSRQPEGVTPAGH